MAFELRELQGNIFPNKFKTEGSNQPDRKGDFLLNGVPFEIAIWEKVGNAGPFLGFKISEKRLKVEGSITERAQATIRKPDPISTGRDMDDDIPF